MEKILARLERVLGRMRDSEGVEPEELEEMNQEWLRAIRRLEGLSQEEMRRDVEENPELRPRLEGLVQVLPEIRDGLVMQKSEVAAQLGAQNRRIQSMRQGYGRPTSNLVLLREQG